MPSQPTTERVQLLLSKLTEPRDREVLMRLQAELTSGARHNEGDINKYSDLWHTHGDKNAPQVDYGTSIRSPEPQPKPHPEAKSNPPDPYTHEVKPKLDEPKHDDKHAGPQDKSSPKR